MTPASSNKLQQLSLTFLGGKLTAEQYEHYLEAA
jgi:hypothetical protein